MLLMYKEIMSISNSEKANFIYRTLLECKRNTAAQPLLWQVKPSLCAISSSSIPLAIS